MSKEFVFQERHEPVKDEHSEQWFTRHHYYSQLFAYFREKDERNWTKCRAIITGEERVIDNDGSFLDRKRKDPDHKVYHKELDHVAFLKPGYAISGDFEEDCDVVRPLFEKGVVIIPDTIEADQLFIREHQPVSTETLIMRANVNRLILEVSDEPESDILKNLWIYGNVNYVECFSESIENLRLPDTVNTIRTTNRINIVGLNKMVEKNEDLDVRLSDIELT